MNPLLLTDYYKTEHIFQYPKNTKFVYSNLTARKSRIPGVDKVVFFGLQYFVKEYLIDRFNKEFFQKDLNEILAEYQQEIHVDTSHIAALHKLGYLPLQIKALEEGTQVPIRVPMLTIRNTHPDFFWLTNYIETLLSNVLWLPITTATIAFEYKKLFNKVIKESVGNEWLPFTAWMGHDFSARGMSSPESMMVSGMAHLLSFTGTDTIAGIYALKKYYGATGLVGGSVPATEHSVMCAGTSVEGEFETFKRLITKIYPSGIVSIVSDTFDLWQVLTQFLPQLKQEILDRTPDAFGNAKVVIRPDSGDPVDIICGNKVKEGGDQPWNYGQNIPETSADKGVIELLWGTFGGTIVNGYKVLNPRVGAIYGDSITLERAKQISERLMAKGFAPILVYGIGSFTYQYNTRDTLGMAVKATWIKTSEGSFDLFKDPITDDGTKKSAKGLIHVNEDLTFTDQVSAEQEETGLLQTIFLNGSLVKETNLDQIRSKLQL